MSWAFTVVYLPLLSDTKGSQGILHKCSVFVAGPVLPPSPSYQPHFIFFLLFSPQSFGLMVSTRSPSPSDSDRSAVTEASSWATSVSDRLDGLHVEDSSAVCDQTVQEVLSGSRILITGAAGFVGAALCHRLLSDPSFNVKQVVAIVRGKTEQDALKRLPKSIHHLVEPQEGREVPQLVVVNGDCTRPNFGLDDDDFEKVRRTEIVIHCAGDTRFTLPVTQAFQSMVS